MTGVSSGPLRTARRVQIALLVCGLIVTGCQATKMRLWSWQMPGIGEAGEVLSVTKRASYLDATLKVQDQDYRFLFPGGYECTQVIKAGLRSSTRPLAISRPCVAAREAATRSGSCPSRNG